MTAPRTFNVYYDESCHLERDRIPVMAWGALSCPAEDTRAIADEIRRRLLDALLAEALAPADDRELEAAE